jgi:salicylate hydroxylase
MFRKILIVDQGQGGGQSIEDGAALGYIFTGAKAEEVPERLKLVEQVRKSRATVMVIFSKYAQDDAHKIIAEAKPFVNGPVPSTHTLFFC